MYAYVADKEVAAASSTYAAYVSSPSTSTYGNFYTAAHAAAIPTSALSQVLTDLNSITSTYSADVSSAISCASSVISAQTAVLPTPTVSLPSCASMSARMVSSRLLPFLAWQKHGQHCTT